MSNKDARREPPTLHQGSDRSAPYPVSRLAPGFDLVDLAREIAQADQAISGRVSAQLRVIADQVKALQAQARDILDQAGADQRLHRARCAFRRIPGHVYHLYADAGGGLNFSMLSPDDWGGRPPQTFVGSYRLESDMSWTTADAPTDPDDSRQLVAELLKATTRSPSDDERALDQ